MSDIGATLPDSFSPDVQIIGVDFAEGYEALEITYVERRNVAPKAYKRETVSLDASLLDKEELSDVVDSLGQFLDAALLHIRNEGGG